jgi:NAD(P)-dependent dehydrogenase (short-subunit alcohol dehydrogenase family)
MKYVLQEQITVDRCVADCFQYLQDFASIEQWDPGVYRAWKLTPGAVKVGSKFRLLLQLPAGKTAEMLYTQIAIKDQQELVLHGVGDQFTALDTISFTPLADDRCQITYRAELELGWIPDSMRLLAKPFMERIGKQAINGMYKALSLPAAPAKPSIREMVSDRLILPAAIKFGQRGYRSLPRKAHSFSMKGKVVAITGPSAGLGLAAACELARLGATLILIGRDPEKMAQASAQIQDFSACPAERLHVYHAELSLLSEIAGIATQVAADHDHIDVLINNAGALFGSREETLEGFERTLAINFLAPILLSRKLATCFDKKSRVINVASGGLYLQGLALDDLQYQQPPFDGSKAYARAKRALLDISHDENSRSTAQYFTTHPGWAATPGVSQSLPKFNNFMQGHLRDSHMGADTMVWLASAPELSHASLEPYFWFDRRPHANAVIPGTATTTKELDVLRNWTNKVLAAYL